MSENFIPLTQSTPVQNKWNSDNNQPQKFQNNRRNSGPKRGGQRHYNKWGNGSRSSYGSNSSNNSYSNDRSSIDAYLHPSMLQDPWENLRRQKQQQNYSSST